MKILAVVDTLEIGGAEISLVEILGRLCDRGHRVELVTLYPGSALRPRLEDRGVVIHALDLPGRYGFLRAARALTARIRTSSPDVVFATLFRAGIAARLAARRTNTPLVDSLVNDSYASRRYEAMSRTGRAKLRIVQEVDRVTARSVDRFLAVSSTVAESGRRALGLPPERISVVHRGRDPEVVRPMTTEDAPSRAAVREELGVPPEAPLLLVTSRLLARKGHRELLEAMPTILRRHPGATLVLAGEGPELGALETLARHLGIANRVRFLGRREDIPHLLRAADLFAFPSHYEGLPGALVEAMLTALPIAAADTPHNRECARDGSTVTWFPVGDAPALARAALAAIADPAREAKGRRGRAEAIERFAIEPIVDRYEELFADVAGAGAGRRGGGS